MRNKSPWKKRYDGLFVLRTDTDHDAETIARVYKMLWMVEDSFRTAKSIMETHPIFHKCDETIRGHVFCSFLAPGSQARTRNPHGTKGPRSPMGRGHPRLGQPPTSRTLPPRQPPLIINCRIFETVEDGPDAIKRKDSKRHQFASIASNSRGVR